VKKKPVKRGRKPGPPEYVKRHCVLVKLDDAQYDTVNKLASGKPLAVYGREKMLAS